MVTVQAPERPSIGFLLEQTLGHVSHGCNLRRSLADVEEAQVAFRELAFDPARRLDHVPPLSNWTVRAGRAARRAVQDLQREGPLDALFVHTHVPATLLGSVMDRLPTVVSLDATSQQLDTLAGSYNHDVHPGAIEAIKHRIHASTFHRAAALITWSAWAADSLTSDYGVDGDRIEVIPPGVVMSQWRRPAHHPFDPDVVRILFVGGDFERKGGPLLVDAVARLSNDPEIQREGSRVELHLVTSAKVEAGPNVHVHRGLAPNDPELIELFHRADIFALPTQGDCSPVVLAEAAAAGLPAVATDVGAIRESVVDGVTGHLVGRSVDSLADALRRLVVDPDHRRKLGCAATEHAERTMDAERNAARVLDVLIDVASSQCSDGSVCLTVSGDIDSHVREDIAARRRPLADYVAIADATGASLLDRQRVRSDETALTAMLRRLAGSDVAMAHHIFRQRHRIDVVITDGEQVGLPLAAMLRVGGRGGMRHVMIGHRLSARKKVIPTRLMRLAPGVDEVLVYSTNQLHVAQELFNRPGQRVRLVDFMVDTEFFEPDRSALERAGDRRPVLATAGREYRDYPTLIEAVRDLDVDLVIASASPWSKRSDNARDVDLPPHVTVTALTQAELRDQFERSDVVVVPLLPNDFQAGVTTILEGMAMARPVVCTVTIGQIDVVVDGVNGRYVPPGDVAAMRTAIRELLADPEGTRAMAERGRELTTATADVRVYADRIADLVRWHLGVARAGQDVKTPLAARR